MVCDTRAKTPTAREIQRAALDRLNGELGRSITVAISPSGAIAFRGWADADRGGLSDACAFRKLTAQGSAELRRAIARAEVMAGRKVDPRAIGTGEHSHDGGSTWHAGH